VRRKSTVESQDEFRERKEKRETSGEEEETAAAMASQPDEKLWTEKLVGKKIVDEPTSDPQVSFSTSFKFLYRNLLQKESKS